MVCSLAVWPVGQLKEKSHSITLKSHDQDPVSAVKKLSEFLGVNATLELCAAIADACSFQKLKHAAETLKEMSPHFKRPDNQPVKIYRKGLFFYYKQTFDFAITSTYSCYLFVFQSSRPHRHQFFTEACLYIVETSPLASGQFFYLVKSYTELIYNFCT